MAAMNHALLLALMLTPAYSLDPTTVQEGDRRAVALSGTRLWSNDGGTPRVRELGPLPAGFPVLETASPLLAALYRQAAEEAGADVRPDGALMAGKEWPGVWTRDVSYSTQLALALVLPEGAWASLKAKTFHGSGAAAGRVRQDTGSGGAWPVSTDRVVWTTAAWELYLARGNRARLAEAYALARGMAEEDWRVAHDPTTGLMYGESSFMDWREQTYPAWMEPADIYGARALGTNVLHAEAYADLARMARALGKPEAPGWDARAAGIRRAIDRRLWDARAGLYRGFLYPAPDDGSSFQTEALGNALAVLYDVAGPKAGRVVASYPLYPYGVPTIFPQLAHPTQPYHNKAVWPFVETYFALAGKRAGNGAAFERGLADVCRAAALFQTNKENFVLESGRAQGTAVNSDRQLWSVAGSLALVYKGLFGLELGEAGYAFKPMVPAWLGPRLALRGLRVREARLDVVVTGTGDRVRWVKLDGRPVTRLSYGLKGAHRVEIQLDGALAGSLTERSPAQPLTAPEAPEPLSVEPRAGWTELLWRADQALAWFTVWRDGAPVGTSAPPRFHEPLDARPHTYGVTATGAGGLVSPHARVRSTGAIWSVQADDPKRWNQVGTQTAFKLDLPLGGRFRAHVVYANGAGPVNTDSKCALRGLYVDGRRVGALVLPQRGTDRWEDWGRSNPLGLTLAPGRHTVEVRQDPLDRNMDEAVNEARVKALVVVQAS
ncbi:MAG: hypothetical protein JWM80_4622 [Cyanobacteria bacterium RYN_339]|nr:hypothetical protein [Cyanobacteria bacterium RYN_339]